MQLKKYDSLNAFATRKGISTISFSEAGGISISGEACEKIGLSAGDRVSLFQDETKPEDWYLAKDKDGFALRQSSSKAKGCSFNSAAICEKVLESVSWKEKKSPVFRLVTEATTVNKMKLYPILTASAKKN
jgi:hypothetical protein